MRAGISALVVGLLLNWSATLRAAEPITAKLDDTTHQLTFSASPTRTSGPQTTVKWAVFQDGTVLDASEHTDTNSNVTIPRPRAGSKYVVTLVVSNSVFAGSFDVEAGAEVNTVPAEDPFDNSAATKFVKEQIHNKIHDSDSLYDSRIEKLNAALQNDQRDSLSITDLKTLWTNAIGIRDLSAVPGLTIPGSVQSIQNSNNKTWVDAVTNLQQLILDRQNGSVNNSELAALKSAIKTEKDANDIMAQNIIPFLLKTNSMIVPASTLTGNPSGTAGTRCRCRKCLLCP